MVTNIFTPYFQTAIQAAPHGIVRESKESNAHDWLVSLWLREDKEYAILLSQ